MKITKDQIREIIREEIQNLNEAKVDHKSIEKAFKTLKRPKDIENWLETFLNKARDYKQTYYAIGEMIPNYLSGSKEKMWHNILGDF